MPISRRPVLFAMLLGACALSGCSGSSDGDAATVPLLNVSYDPTRELYKDVNAGFGRKWRAEHGQTLRFRLRPGGSGTQARGGVVGPVGRGAGRDTVACVW